MRLLAKIPFLILALGPGLSPAAETLAAEFFKTHCFKCHDHRKLKGDRRRVATGQRLVDRVLESHRDLKRRLGKDDSRKLDHYLDSVRAVEKDIERMQAWSDKPKPAVSADGLSFDASVKNPATFIRTLYNLIYLAFQTDTTRYATYTLQSMVGSV
jgi:hypothetical protein